MMLSSAGHAILPKIKELGIPLRAELAHAHGHARLRAAEIREGHNRGHLRLKPMTKKADAEPACIEGFGSRLHARVKQRVNELRRRLRPGDVVVSNPRQWRGVARVFKPVSVAVQGTRFGHSAIYDGKGNVIEARAHTVIKRPLLDLARCNEIMALRPKAPPTMRQRAVAWMNKHVGNDAMRVAPVNLVAHGLKPTLLSRAHEGTRQAIDRALCSSLVANAYAKLPFNPRRRIADTRPVDILQSEHVKVVGKVT